MDRFDSDYMEGACPEIMARLMQTNLEQTSGYGTDPYCAEARRMILDTCGLTKGDVHFFIGGTAANSTVIDGILRRHEGVIAAESGHINAHEAGAIESCGHKVLALPSHNGKVDAGEVDRYVTEFYKDESHEHCVAPGMVYISYPTETGTLYSKEELEELSAVCHKHNIPLYLDGARLGYGLASRSCDLTIKDIARLCDVFYIGGTKVGCLFGEAVVVPDAGRLPHFFPLMKQHGAVLAKGRLLGLQFGTLFRDGLYFRLGKNAVDRALELKAGLLKAGYKMAVDSPTNQQFFTIPNRILDTLAGKATFEFWGPRGEEESLVRFVTSWATKPDQVERLVRLLCK